MGGVLPDWASCPVLPHTMATLHNAYACIQFREFDLCIISIPTQNISSQWLAPSFGMAVKERSPGFRPYRHRRRIRFSHRYMLWEGQKASLAHTIWLWGGQMPILPSPGSATAVTAERGIVGYGIFHCYLHSEYEDASNPLHWKRSKL